MRRNKKGFTLVECIVALMLFSVITVSVLAVFKASRSQIAAQTDKYQFDLYGQNIIAAFQGSDTWDTFQKVLKRDLKINIGTAETEETTVPVGTGGTEGSYGFDTNNVPVAVPFSRVVVQDGYATFENAEGTKLVSFAGDYPNDCLRADEERGWDPADVYYAPERYYNGTIRLTGSITTTKDDGEDGGSGTFTWECDGEQVVFSLTMPLVGTKEVTTEACDLDRFLWKKGWYLDNVSRYYDLVSGALRFETIDNYYFIVRDSTTNQPVKNEQGQCLYYRIASTTNNLEVLNYRATTTDFLTATADHFFMDLGANAEITYAFGTERSVPASWNFKNVVTDDEGNTFKDKWYYYQWIVAKGRGMTGLGAYSLNHPLGRDSYQSYMEYKPKEDVKAEIYYALAASKTILLYNSEGYLLFPYTGNTTEPLEMLHRESGCYFRDKSRWYDTEKVYDKWYQKGFMPAKEIDEARFVDNFGTGEPSYIGFYSGGEVYVRFLYPDDRYETYLAERDSILGLEGAYAPKYNYTKVFSYPLKHLTTASELAPYKSVAAIQNAIEAGGTDTVTMTYYTADSAKESLLSLNSKYKYTFEYYTYTVTLTKTSDLTDYEETSHMLTVGHKDGQNTFTEEGKATATVTTKRVPTVTVVHDTITTTGNATRNIPASAIPASLKNGTQVDNFVDRDILGRIRSNYSDIDWVKTNLVENNTDWNYTRTATVNVTFGAGNTGSSAPADFPSAWTLQSATDPKLITAGVPALLCEDKQGPYTLQIGEEAIFVSNGADFEINGTAPVTSSGLSYEVIGGGDEGDVSAKTYYLKLDYRDRTFIVQVTYSDYTQQEMTEDGQVLEPRIAIWLLPQDKVPADIRAITGEAFKQYLYLTYRKG